MGTSAGTPGQATITPVYWAPPGYSFPSTYKSIVNGYLQDLSLDSARKTNTNVFAVANQYYQQDSAPGSKPQPIRYHVAAGLEVDDRSAYPTGGCNPATTFTACVNDADLQTELTAKLNSMGLPRDDSHLYLAMFPAGVETCEPPDTNNVVKCSANDYCAYHSSSSAAPYLIYANEPMPDPPSCSDPLNGPQAPNGDQAADAEVSLISHEANESITDWAGAWMDKAMFENGDECVFVYGAPQGSPGSYYNQVVGRGRYYTQDEFSNEDFALGKGDITTTGGVQVNGCVSQEELPSAVFSAPSGATTGTPVTVDGSQSSDPDNTSAPLTSTWDFGDGAPIPNSTVASHVYCGPGDYNVALTVTDADGWQATVTHPLHVSPGVPIIAGIAPQSGPSAGRTAVVISGCGFTGTTQAAFGNVAATNVVVSDAKTLTVSSPSHAPGAVDITVTTPGGTSTTTSADRFSFVLAPVFGGGILESGPAAGVTGAATSDVFVEGTDHGIWRTSWDGANFSSWAPGGGIMTSDPAAAVMGPNDVKVFVRGTDNGLWMTTWNGSTFSSWHTLGGVLTSAPEAVHESGSPTKIDVFVRGTDLGLWEASSNDDGVTWSGWQPLGGILTSDAGVASSSPGHLDVVVIGTDSGLWERSWNSTSGWANWIALGGIATSGPGVTSCAAGHLDVFVRGTDGGYWQRGFDGSVWSSWTAEGNAWSSDPSPVCRQGTNIIDVFGRGSDSALYEIEEGGT